MHVSLVVRGAPVDGVEEVTELGAPRPSVRLVDDRAGLDVERGEEIARAVAGIVVGVALELAGVHRHDRHDRIAGGDLRFLVCGADERTVRRVEVESDDVAYLLDELRILREFERLRAVRLEGEGTPDAAHRRLREADPGGQIAGSPVGAAGRGSPASLGGLRQSLRR